MKTALSLLLILILSTAFNNAEMSRIIQGTVNDDQGFPLQGVTITVKGTKQMTSSNVDGKYTIEIEPGAKSLLFQYIGMLTIEETIGTRSIIDVVMTPDLKVLEELVVYENDLNASREESKVFIGVKRAGDYRSKSGQNSPAAYGQRPFERYQPTPPFNTEGYTAIQENGFKSVKNNPLSTFSIDVDRASYSNVRRFINQGSRPPIDAVRIEEMINYFRYDYPAPEGKHPFSVYTEAAVCPWDRDHILLQIGLNGMEIDKTELPSSNLVFLIDVSGSMESQNKLPLLKSAFTMLVNELRPSDRVSIVVYAGAAGMVLEPTSGAKKEKILASINRLNAGGSTAGGAGLALAYKLAEENFIDGGNNRIILATDGDFNVGASSNAEMERLIEKKRDRGIFMTVLGFGMGNYKDDKMEIIADKGNGNYAYIDNLQEARKVLVSEFGGTLFTIAKDVKFQLEFNPARVKSYRLVGYENRLLNDEDFNDDKKDAGEMGAGHTVTAIYELVPASSDSRLPSIDPLKYQANRPVEKLDYSEELLTIKVRYKRPDGEKSILMERPFSGPVGDIYEASDNLRFAASVAGFGMILRESENSGNFNLNKVVEMAERSRGEDEEGYRAEFIRLVKTVKDMRMLSNLK